MAASRIIRSLREAEQTLQNIGLYGDPLMRGERLHDFKAETLFKGLLSAVCVASLCENQLRSPSRGGGDRAEYAKKFAQARQYTHVLYLTLKDHPDTTERQLLYAEVCEEVLDKAHDKLIEAGRRINT